MRRLALAASLALAGCTAGQDFHIPDTAMSKALAANAPFRSGADPAFVQAPLPPHWWRLYDSPQLDSYVEEALAANTGLRAADANLRRANDIVREVEAGRTIQTDLTAEAFAARPGGYTETIPLGLSYSYLLGASVDYPLDLAGGIKRGTEAARDDSEAAQAARDQVRVTVAAAVTRSFADACSANVSLAATRHVLDIENQTLDSMRRLFKGGRGTSFDVTRARAAADKSAAAIPTYIAARQAALFSIAALMGRAPADYPKELGNCDTPPMLERPLPIGDGSALILRRTDIRAAERKFAAATAGIGVATSDLYPKVNIGGAAGFADAISAFTDPASFGGLVGPVVTWAFPNRKLIRAKIDAAGAVASGAEAQYDGTVIEALRQTETALSSYAREIDRDRALEASRNDADKASSDSQRLFHYGRTGVLDVLTAQSNLATAEATLADSKAELIDKQVDVFLSLGGGWEP